MLLWCQGSCHGLSLNPTLYPPTHIHIHHSERLEGCLWFILPPSSHLRKQQHCSSITKLLTLESALTPTILSHLTSSPTKSLLTIFRTYPESDHFSPWRSLQQLPMWLPTSTLLPAKSSQQSRYRVMSLPYSEPSLSHLNPKSSPWKNSIRLSHCHILACRDLWGQVPCFPWCSDDDARRRGGVYSSVKDQIRSCVWQVDWAGPSWTSSAEVSEKLIALEMLHLGPSTVQLEDRNHDLAVLTKRCSISVSQLTEGTEMSPWMAGSRSCSSISLRVSNTE